MYGLAENSLLYRLFRLVSNPAKWRRAVYTRVRTIPFYFGISTAWPGTYLGYLPDRYSHNYDKYKDGGGLMRHRETRYFVKGNEINGCGDLARYYFFNLVIDQIVKEKLQGDIAELGVYKGNTSYFLVKAAKALGVTAYLLDTYEGFFKDDLKGVDANHSIQFSDTSIKSVQDLVGTKNVRFIKGHFPGSIDQMPDTLSFCLVHIDCDLYEPFRAALSYFYPRLTQGGFLILHDYSSLHWDGAERAVDEFFSGKPEKVVPIPDKSGTVVIRKV